MAPLTKWHSVVTRADHIPRMVRQAFRAMTTGLPYDVRYDAVPDT